MHNTQECEVCQTCHLNAEKSSRLETLWCRRRYFRQDQNWPGFVGRTPQRPVGGPGEGIGMIGESLIGLAFGFTVCRCQLLWSRWLSASRCKDFAKDVGRAMLGRRLALPGSMGRCALAHHSATGTSRRNMGHTASFSPSQEGAGGCLERSPVQAFSCALLGLHLLAAEGEVGSSGGQSPDFRDMW